MYSSSSNQNNPIKRLFIISPIDEPNTPTRIRSDQVKKHIIDPSALEKGYNTIRSDQISKPGRIDRQIIEHLIHDELVVADITGQNPNVFYELAVRHITGRPVIIIGNVGEELPFDISAQRVIFYELSDPDSVVNARDELKRQISSVEADDFKVDSPIYLKIPINSENRISQLRENLIKEIYKPLSRVLWESIKHLKDDNFSLSSGDIEDILSNTYYARQMPSELLERLNRHIQKMDDLHEKLSYTRETLHEILLKNIFTHIEIIPPKNYQRIQPHFILIAEDEENNAEINIYDLYKLLLNNQLIKEYIETHYPNKYNEINIQYQKPYHISLEILTEVFWKQCLKQVALDSKISQMKKDRSTLIIETESLIDMIIKC